MRTWGRVSDEEGNLTWVEVNDDKGDPSYLWLTTMIQTLKLGLGESPFFVQYGIPAHQSIIEQVAPDYYVNQVQQQYANYFLNINITKNEDEDHPNYNIDVTLLNGERIEYKKIPF